MYLEQKSKELVRTSSKTFTFANNNYYRSHSATPPVLKSYQGPYLILFSIIHTYMRINAIDKVSFLPNQSAIAPRTREPAITPAMKMLIVIGGIQC